MKDHIVSPNYSGPNRRAKSIPDEVREYIHEEFREYEAEFREYIRSEFAGHEKREQEWVEKLYDAFPERDVVGHCDYHKRKIDAAKSEAEFWQAAKSAAIEKGVAGLFSVLKWIAVLAILSFAYKIGVGPLVAKILGVGV